MDDLLDLDFAAPSSQPPAQARFPRGRTAFDYLAGPSTSSAPVQHPARPPAPSPAPAPSRPPSTATAAAGDAFSTLFGTTSTSSSAAPPTTLSMQARLEERGSLAGRVGGDATASSLGGSLGGGAALGGNRSGSTPALLQPTQQQRVASPSSSSLLSPTSRTASPLSPSFPLPPSPASRAPALAATDNSKAAAADVWDFDLLSTAVPSAKSPSPAPSSSSSSAPALARAPARAPAPDDDDRLFDLGFDSAPAPAPGRAGPAAPLHDADEFDLLDAFAAPATTTAASPSPSPSPSSTTIDAARRAFPTHAAPSPTPSPPSPPPHLLGQLVEMGFSPRAASAALVASRTGAQGGWDLERALEVLPPQAPALDPARILQDQAGDMLLSAQKLGFSMFKSANALLGEGKKALARRIEEQRAAAAAAGAGAGAAGGRDAREGAPGREGGQQQFPGRPRWWTEEMEREEQQAAPTGGREGRAPPPPTTSSFRDDDDDDEVEPARPFAEPRRVVERREAPAPAPAAPSPASEYRSPFRRAKAPAPPAVAEADLLSGAPAPAPAAPRRSTPSPSLGPSSHAAVPPRAARASPSPSPSSRDTAPTARRLPSSSRAHLSVPVSAPSLATASAHKQTGNAHFKLGRFGEATVAYSRALEALPGGWIGRVPLLNNRAQARLRSGEEKGAVEDCGEAVGILLQGGGGGGGAAGEPDLATLEADSAALPPEVVALYAPGAPLDLKDQLGKALGRRAKALEALEKWALAREDWERVQRCGDEAVLRGAGGAKMVGEGVARCRKVLDPAPASSSSSAPSSARPATAAAAASRPKPRPAVQGSGDAVRALQAQQAAAAAEDDERHQLKDVVDARIAAWKGGKEANLRALIASLDKVLWPELGWKTVGMHELISEGQLKVRYVRAIAKLHPDKLNVANTTVEQRMVAALVFAALNDAWNGMK
ncbi:hypothetical protein JCM8208_007171 [Rhodotorula glutinis]